MAILEKPYETHSGEARTYQYQRLYAAIGAIIFNASLKRLKVDCAFSGGNANNPNMSEWFPIKMVRTV